MANMSSRRSALPSRHVAVGVTDTAIVDVAHDDDLERPAAIEIRQREGAHFAIAERVARPQLGTSSGVDGELVSSATDDDL